MILNSEVLFTLKRDQPDSAEQERGKGHALYGTSGKIGISLSFMRCPCSLPVISVADLSQILKLMYFELSVGPNPRC
jgi:hypothetical protein